MIERLDMFIEVLYPTRCSSEVERDSHRYQRAENIAQSDPMIDVTPGPSSGS